MKKIYQEVSIEVLVLSAMDVVTLSNWYDDTGDDIFTPL